MRSNSQTKKLKLSKNFQVKITKQGILECRVSAAAGAFHLEPEVLLLLMELAKVYPVSPDDLSDKVDARVRALLKNPLTSTDVQKLLKELHGAGILVGPSGALSSAIDDGFGDPWIQWAMLADQQRSQSYWDVISSSVTPNSRVLDLGSGSGFFSAAALSAGAKSVLAIEETAAAKGIEPLLKSLGLLDKKRFQLQNANSFDVKSTPCDIIVHELFGNDPFSEGMLATLADAQRFATENCLWLPGKMEVFAELIDLRGGPLRGRVAAMRQALRGGRENTRTPACERAIKAFARQHLANGTFMLPAHLAPNDFVRCGQPQHVFSVPLDGTSPLNPEGVAQLPDPSGFSLPVVALWFRAWLDPCTCMSSHPQENDGASHWAMTIATLPSNRTPGPLQLRVWVEDNNLQVQL